ncbi:MAG: di-trans,poly-cis-decaprenylcistransferase [Chlamydiales bacterium]|nr:di-trans,poly-cis-decaprenylcistransferase [Chlamydiales bacterium]
MAVNRSVIDPVFSPQELALLDPKHIPHHIAIIPDGNRRWAESNMLPMIKGHQAGYEQVVHIVRAAKELGVKVITLYAFSTENWKRSPLEVQSLMQLTLSYLAAYQQKLVEENIRLSAIGNLDQIPSGVKAILDDTMLATKNCTEFDLVLGINYGGRDEIVRAVAKILAKNIDPKLITEKMISEHLDTSKWQDPDLLIRTSGERRLSNFLLWQSSYAEVYIESIAWPEFSHKHLLQAVRDYQTRERRLGGRT